MEVCYNTPEEVWDMRQLCRRLAKINNLLCEMPQISWWDFTMLNHRLIGWVRAIEKEVIIPEQQFMKNRNVYALGRAVALED